MSTHSPTPDPDALARALAAIEHHLQVVIARSNAAADGGSTRVWDLAFVARTAMREVTRLTQLEREFTATTPEAAARLRLLVDLAAACIAAVAIAGTARTMLADIEQEDR